MNDLGKNFEMVRFAKCKTTTAVNKCENEHSRKDGYEDRPNINKELSSTNISMSNFKGTQMEIFERQKEKYNQTHKKKLRKDAVKALDGVFAFSDASQISDIALGKSVAQFLGEFFPNCPAKIWIHNDEKQKHAHLMVCPINGSGECITDKVMRPAVFRKMQTRFAEICQQNGIKDVQRGISKADRFEKGLPQNYHKNKWQYAKEMELKEQKAREAEEREKRAILSAKKAQEDRENAELAQKNAEENLRKILSDTTEEIKFQEYVKKNTDKLLREKEKIRQAVKDANHIYGSDADLDYIEKQFQDISFDGIER